MGDKWQDRIDARTPPATGWLRTALSLESTSTLFQRTCVAPLSVCSLPLHRLPLVLNPSSPPLRRHHTLLPSHLLLFYTPPLFSGHDTAMPLSEKENHVKGGLEEYEREDSSRYPFLLSYRECKLLGIAGVRTPHLLSPRRLISSFPGRLLSRCLRPLHHQRECLFFPRVRHPIHATASSP